MKAHAACAALLCLGLLSGCGAGNFAPGIGGNLQSIVVTPSTPSVPLGETQQFTATGHYRDGTTQDITASVTWSSSNTNVATVSGSGFGSTHSTGSSTISATLSKVTGSSTFTVTNAVLVSIAITPANSQVFLGTLNQFTATGTYSDQTTKDITSSVTWSSSNPSAASINGGGLVTALALGSLTISATSGSITGSTSVTVQSSTLTSITIVPANGSIAVSTTEQFHALGNYSDGSVQNLTRQVTWASSNTAVLQIVSGGNSRGLTPGTTTVTATLGSVTGSTPFTVTSATIVSITVSPASQTIAVGTTLDFSALGRFSDGTFQDITAVATWSSDNTAVATVDVNATATAVSPGTANISATFNGVTGSAPVTVSSATITSISGSVSCGDKTPGSGTITITGTSTGGAISGAITSMLVNCQGGSSFAIINGLTTVGGAPATLEIGGTPGGYFGTFQTATASYLYSSAASGLYTPGNGHVQWNNAVMTQTGAGGAGHTITINGDATCGT